MSAVSYIRHCLCLSCDTADFCCSTQQILAVLSDTVDTSCVRLFDAPDGCDCHVAMQTHPVCCCVSQQTQLVGVVVPQLVLAASRRTHFLCLSRRRVDTEQNFICLPCHTAGTSCVCSQSTGSLCVLCDATTMAELIC